MTTIPDFLPDPAGVDGFELPYAGAITRAMALAIDGVLVNLSLAAFTAIVASLVRALFPDFVGDLPLQTTAVAAVAWGTIGSSYLLFFWTLVGQTPGMRILGLRVASLAGERLGLGQAIKRLIALVVFPFGAVAMVVTERRQALHDRFADSIVVYEPEKVRPGIGPSAAAPGSPPAPLPPAPPERGAAPGPSGPPDRVGSARSTGRSGSPDPSGASRDRRPAGRDSGSGSE
ncbi:MAG: RDD family protein [Solirubrobacterales bacterium]